MKLKKHVFVMDDIFRFILSEENGQKYMSCCLSQSVSQNNHQRTKLKLLFSSILMVIVRVIVYSP
jgi:hypothetical protein